MTTPIRLPHGTTSAAIRWRLGQGRSVVVDVPDKVTGRIAPHEVVYAWPGERVLKWQSDGREPATAYRPGGHP